MSLRTDREAAAPVEATIADPVEAAPAPPARAALPAGRTPGELHQRAELLSDLEYAVDPYAAPTVLALFGFRTLKQQLESLFEVEGDELLEEVAAQFVRAAGNRVLLYEPRRGEYGALFAGRLKDVQPRLDRVVKDVDKHMKKLGIRALVGVAELPIEATTPGAALDLADNRRGSDAQDLRPPARRSVISRVSTAIGKSFQPSQPTDDRAGNEHSGQRWI